MKQVYAHGKRSFATARLLPFLDLKVVAHLPMQSAPLVLFLIHAKAPKLRTGPREGPKRGMRPEQTQE